MNEQRITQIGRAVEFRNRHREGAIIVLPNAFDVATARLIARHRPLAIGTSSAAIAAIAGYPDGEQIEVGEMLEAIARITKAVDVGVTADIEAAYGDEVDDAVILVERLIAIGAIGFNIQDTGHPRGRWAGGLLPIQRAVAKISAMRDAADEAGVPLVINARTDTFLEDGDQVVKAIERGNAYLDAGADCVFAPGVGARDEISRLVAGVNGPVNIYAGPGVPSVAELESLNVRRLSIGCGPYQACLALVDRAATELLERGTYEPFITDQLSTAEIAELLA